MNKIQLFLFIEGASFLTAALVHFGVIARGYEHRRAGIAESVIGVVLLGGLVLITVQPAWNRKIGFGAQGFALLGTLVGITMVAIGVGPRSVPDVIYHLAILIVLIVGLSVVARNSRKAVP